MKKKRSERKEEGRKQTRDIRPSQKKHPAILISLDRYSCDQM
jgi:hypothetical protein